MPRREAAREEAAFLRGEVGVDGAATEEAQDRAEIERLKARDQFLRGKSWLGRELLSWALYRSEAAEPLFTFEEQPVTVLFADKLVLRAPGGDVIEETVRGALAPYSPLVRQALARGLLVHQARLHLTRGEREFEVTLDAEFFDPKSAKLPELTSEDEGDRLRERLVLSEELAGMVRALIERFLKLRASPKWAKDEVPALRAWMAEAKDSTKRRGR